MSPGKAKWPGATEDTLELILALQAIQATADKQDSLQTVLDSINDKTPSTADIKGASASTTSDSNATVIEVASGSGWLLDVSQLLEPYAYGTNTGLVTITIDGVSLGERALSIAEFAGSYPGSLVMSYNINIDVAIRYTTSLKVEHRITKDAGTPEVHTTVTYTEE